jgi:hypothetical protein
MTLRSVSPLYNMQQPVGKSARGPVELGIKWEGGTFRLCRLEFITGAWASVRIEYL